MDHEPSMADLQARRVSLGVTFVVLAGGVALSYALDRAYERWWEANHPYAELRSSLARAKVRFRARRNVTLEVAAVVGAIIGEVVRALDEDA